MLILASAQRVIQGLFVRIISSRVSLQMIFGWLFENLDAMGMNSFMIGFGQMYKQMGTVKIIACFHVSFKAASLILDIRDSASSVVELVACIAYKAYQYNINNTNDMAYQYWIQKFRHFIQEWILKHFNWQIRQPHLGQLEREMLPQIEQYFLDGQRGLPTFILQKLGSLFYYKPYS